jgi:hypothetical protein
VEARAAGRRHGHPGEAARPRAGRRDRLLDGRRRCAADGDSATEERAAPGAGLVRLLGRRVSRRRARASGAADARGCRRNEGDPDVQDLRRARAEGRRLPEADRHPRRPDAPEVRLVEGDPQDRGAGDAGLRRLGHVPSRARGEVLPVARRRPARRRLAAREPEQEPAGDHPRLNPLRHLHHSPADRDRRPWVDAIPARGVA